MKLSYPKEIEICLELLNEEFEAYIVGGAVRNQLMNIACSDYDITTSASPEQITEVFINYRVFNSGKKHGSIGVLIDKTLVEITTYRIESDYPDHRHPKTVSFTDDLKLDLQRRDFTINTLCYNNKMGLVDHYDGLEDFNKCILRTVKDPEISFFEDSLRILRAIRIASELNFKIDKDTKKAIFNNIQYLNYVSIDRFSQEFSKFVVSEKFCDYLMEYLEVFAMFIPELDTLKKNDVLFHRSLMAIREADKINYRLALLFVHLNPTSVIQSASTFIMMAKRLNFNNEITGTVARFIQNANIDMRNDKSLIKKRLNQFGDSFLDFLAFRKYFDLSDDQYTAITKTVGTIIANNECYSLRQLHINGDDLIKLELSGKQISISLNKLLDLVINDKLDNNKYKLIDATEKLFQK